MGALFAPIEAIGNLLHQVLLMFYYLTGNFGWAIVLLTLTAKLILHPLIRKQLHSMRKVRALAPKVSALRERFKDDPQKLNVELINLYRAHRISPFSGFVSSLLQAPILVGLWTLFRTPNVFVPAVGIARKIFRRLPAEDVSAIRNADKFFGLPLDATPNFASILLNPGWLIIPLLVGFATYWQQHLTMTDPQQVWLLLIMAGAFAYFAMQLPVGMSIYWITSSIASLAENYLVMRRPAHTSLARSVLLQRRKRSNGKQED